VSSSQETGTSASVDNLILKILDTNI